MKVVKGNLIQLAKTGVFNVIVHGANCINAMGSGIAVQIKEEFPTAYEADTNFNVPLGPARLGKISAGYSSWYDLIIVNAYTQVYPAKDANDIAVDYNAVRSTMQLIKKQYGGASIGLPMIGAGLANGDWPTIFNIIQEELEGEDVTIVEYDATI